MTEERDPGWTDWGLLEPLAASAGATSDDAVLEAMIDVERALLRAGGDLSVRDADTVADAFRPEAVDRAALLEGLRTGGVPVIPLVSQLRAMAEAVVPGSSSSVHAGATSQDVLDSALVLVASRTIRVARERLLDTGAALVALATNEVQTIAIARTLGQHAAQSTVGVVAAGWLDGVTSAIEEVDSLSFPVQLGGAVGTGENLGPDVRAVIAADLGLDDPGRSWHTERSPILRIAASVAVIAAVLGRIGRDVGFLARTEIGEVVLGATGGSSAMPHKRNPVDAVLLTANGLRAPGLLATVHTAAVSQDARPVGEWHAEWAAFRTLLRIALESADAAASMLSDISIDHAAVQKSRAISPGLQHDEAATIAASQRVVGVAVRRFRSLSTKDPR
ncbi:lyase family protein [Leifsonia sp. YIM 134122]|uniref:Lyase family protein n=1 Tax=Leifsonia stereocauli TaxID=3134136 RepID=A0ABU9WA42_9MICO